MSISSINNYYSKELHIQQSVQFKGKVLQNAKRSLLPAIMLAGSLIMPQPVSAFEKNNHNIDYNPAGEYYQGHIDFSKISKKDIVKSLLYPYLSIVGFYGLVLVALSVFDNKDKSKENSSNMDVVA